MKSEKEILDLIIQFNEKTGELSSSGLIRNALDFISKSLLLKRTSVALLSHDKKGFFIQASSYTIATLDKGDFVPFKAVNCSHVVESLQCIYRPDIRHADISAASDKHLLASGILSDFLLPMIAEGQCIGTLNCGSTSLDGISNEQQQILQLLAPIFAIALHRALLMEQLIEKEERYHKLINTTAEGFWQINLKSETIDVNQTLCNMLGYSREEMLGKTPFDLVDRHNLKIFKKQIADAKNSKHRRYEISLTRKNGESFPAVFNATSVIDREQGYVGSFAFVTDITLRKQAEEALKLSEEKYRSIFEGAADGIVLTDKKANVLQVNPSFTEITGLSPESVIGRSGFKLARKFVTLKQLPKVMNLLNDIVVGESSPVLVLNYLHQYLEIFARKQKNDYFVGIIRDITKRKLAEEELKNYRQHLEEQVMNRTVELIDKNKELERFNNLFVGREFRIKELRDEVKLLKKQLSERDSELNK